MRRIKIAKISDNLSQPKKQNKQNDNNNNDNNNNNNNNLLISFAQLSMQKFSLVVKNVFNRISTLILSGVTCPKYGIYSIRRSGRLLNFWVLRVGAFSRLGAY